MAQKDEKDRTLIIVGIVGAAAVVGGFLYLVATSSPKKQAPPQTPPPQAPPPQAPPPSALVDTPAPTTTPNATYQLNLDSDKSIGLQIGETVLLSPPALPAGAVDWTTSLDSQSVGWTATPLVMRAAAPGVTNITVAPENANGDLMAPVFNVRVTVSQSTGAPVVLPG